jgi:hypothetical protein
VQPDHFLGMPGADGETTSHVSRGIHGAKE